MLPDELPILEATDVGAKLSDVHLRNRRARFPGSLLGFSLISIRAAT